MIKIGTLLAALALFSSSVMAQGVINSMDPSGNNSDPHHVMGCGSFDFMEHLDHQSPGFMNASNQFMQEVSNVVRTRRSAQSSDLIRVPVVFHVVYNATEINLPDSVIQNQLDILNACFRRQNADTANLRPEFVDLVGDSKIEFVLATKDPQGNPSSGITRTASPVEYFGGVLPYSQTQTAQIQQWVQDSLYYNYFRITQDSLGGVDPWDPDNYVNIWIGDLRIYEPLIGGAEEIVLFGMATPPVGHMNWPDSAAALWGYNQGIIMHYMNIGSNNPNPFPSPYGIYNTRLDGELMVHEMGHYLGLRHIWGDGGCSLDDFVSDTPRGSAASSYNCNKTGNSCLDTINGADLPNMVENFMDYSSANCMNSFTNGQIDVMRYVLENFRVDLETSTVDLEGGNSFSIYPNPTTGTIVFPAQGNSEIIEVTIYGLDGRIVRQNTWNASSQWVTELPNENGVYIIHINSDQHNEVLKVVKL